MPSYVRVYTGDNGKSHIEDFDPPFEPFVDVEGAHGDGTPMENATGITIRRGAPGYLDSVWRPTPRFFAPCVTDWRRGFRQSSRTMAPGCTGFFIVMTGSPDDNPSGKSDPRAAAKPSLNHLDQAAARDRKPGQAVQRLARAL